MNNERPIELEEYCERLPVGHAFRHRLDALLWKERHPLKEFYYQMKFNLVGHR